MITTSITVTYGRIMPLVSSPNFLMQRMMCLTVLNPETIVVIAFSVAGDLTVPVKERENSIGGRPTSRRNRREREQCRSSGCSRWRRTARPIGCAAWCLWLRPSAPLITFDRPDHTGAVGRNTAVADITRPGIDRLRGRVHGLRIASAEANGIRPLHIRDGGIGIHRRAPAGCDCKTHQYGGPHDLDCGHQIRH